MGKVASGGREDAGVRPGMGVPGAFCQVGQAQTPAWPLKVVGPWAHHFSALLSVILEVMSCQQNIP